MINARIAAALTAVVLLSACIAAEGTAVPETTTALRIDATQSASVSVSTPIAGKQEFVDSLEQAITGQLMTKQVFQSVRPKTATTDLRVEATIVEIEEVSQGARLMLGIFAGQASIRVRVVVRNLTTQEELGQMVAWGRSSGGNIFAGTTSEALEQVATQIADYLLRNRRA